MATLPVDERLSLINYFYRSAIKRHRKYRPPFFQRMICARVMIESSFYVALSHLRTYTDQTVTT